ncbi:Rpn family recombination-promoting nuclease/putative transposase [Carnimonas bestiolae]|uniref:Rpn family recombination-promoting nuclease/putative transposase n=1 Tax=Carnimonas bestiolae TaxID=3402172 RepID=UPI003EDC221B
MHRCHDGSYKLLFSHPRPVIDLLQGFVVEQWVKQLRFDTLERVSNSFVSDSLSTRECDIVWRLRASDDQWTYLYVMLEFQSTVDHWMALRVMTYVGLLYQELIKQRTIIKLSSGSAKALPVIIPIVLYSGNKPWNAARDIADLIAPLSNGLAAYTPSLRYLLLEQNVLANQPQRANNLASAIFRLEHPQSAAEIAEIIGGLAEELDGESQRSLRRAFEVWINRVVLPRYLPAPASEMTESLYSLEELNVMAATREEFRWPVEYYQEGIRDGVQKGLEQGRRQSQIECAEQLIRQTAMHDSMIAGVSGLAAQEVALLRAKIAH